MSVKHIFRQGPMLAMIARVASSSVAASLGLRKTSKDGLSLSVCEAEVPPRHPDLIADYVREVGGDPAAYEGIVPPHMFSQWGMPLMQRAIAQLPYNLVRILNAGCEYTALGPLPASEPLVLKAELKNVDDNGKRALITTSLITGTREQPEIIKSQVTAIVPLKKAGERNKESSETKKQPTLVPEHATEIARTTLPANAGLRYAYVTGDFNPVHWLLPYAWISGYRGRILHGFAGAARIAEDLNRNLFSGRTDMVQKLEVRFVKPLVLPANVGTYIDGSGGVYVGEAPGEVAAFAGHYGSAKETSNG